MQIKESTTPKRPGIASADLKEHWMELLLVWNLYPFIFADEIT